MTVIFFDTETTGFHLKHLPMDDKGQPRIVQLAYIVTTDEGRVLEEHCEITSPAIRSDEVFEIPEGAAKVHGITTEIANQYGNPQKAALLRMLDAINRYECSKIVSHNIEYDMSMLEIAALRFGLELPDMATVCTMKASRDIVRLPPTERMIAYGRNGYKPPKLEEAYSFFSGRPMENAHDALADVRACKEVYFRLIEQGLSL